MKIRFPTDRSAWRNRFVTIARQFEAAGDRAQGIAGSAGLRARPRLAGQGPSRRVRAAA
jgi:hypothetical protein